MVPSLSTGDPFDAKATSVIDLFPGTPDGLIMLTRLKDTYLVH
jgi:hypothetical protein